VRKTMTSEHSRLDYAPPPPSPSFRRPMRMALLILGASTAAWSAWRFGPHAVERARFVYFQAQCDRFVGPADQAPPPQTAGLP